MLRKKPKTVSIEAEAEKASDELLGEVKKVVSEQHTEEEPEVKNYEISMIAMVVHTIISEVTTFALPSAESLHHPGLNYVEAGTAILRGGKQLSDDETHRPIVTKVKGFTNVATGIGLVTITAVGTTLGAAAAAALSAQGFAAALGVAFIISCDEVMRAARRMEDPEYWLSDSLKQWDKLNEKSIPKLREEIHRLEHTPWIRQHNSAAMWALNQKKERLVHLQAAADELKEDIQARVTTNKTCWEYYEKKYLHSDDPLAKKAQELIGDHPQLNSKNAQDIEAKMMTKCQKDLSKALSISILTGVTFTGMLLLCIPGAQPAGALLVGIAVTVMAVKYAEQIIKHAPAAKEKLMSLLNKSDKAHSSENAVELQPVISKPSMR